jgi:recombination protein RecT
MPTVAKKQTINTSVATAKKNLEREKLSLYLSTDTMKKALLDSLGTPERCIKFTTALISAVANNPSLSNCSNASLVSAALLGESLDLSPSAALGQYYIVPYGRDNPKATFQIGWKGYYQLALRSGQYKSLGATAIKEGELVSFNPITDDAVFEPIMDYEKRENAQTIGYYAWFELENGFSKKMYWPKAKMEAHAKRYSKAYNSEKATNTSFWKTDFDGMALKTMYRQIISKYGVMSTEMERAVINDMTSGESLKEDDRVYFDNDSSSATVIDAE